MDYLQSGFIVGYSSSECAHGVVVVGALHGTLQMVVCSRSLYYGCSFAES